MGHEEYYKEWPGDSSQATNSSSSDNAGFTSETASNQLPTPVLSREKRYPFSQDLYDGPELTKVFLSICI